MVPNQHHCKAWIDTFLLIWFGLARRFMLYGCHFPMLAPVLFNVCSLFPDIFSHTLQSLRIQRQETTGPITARWDRRCRARGCHQKQPGHLQQYGIVAVVRAAVRSSLGELGLCIRAQGAVGARSLVSRHLGRGHRPCLLLSSGGTRSRR